MWVARLRVSRVASTLRGCSSLGEYRPRGRHGNDAAPDPEIDAVAPTVMVISSVPWVIFSCWPAAMLPAATELQVMSA